MRRKRIRFQDQADAIISFPINDLTEDEKALLRKTLSVVFLQTRDIRIKPVITDEPRRIVLIIPLPLSYLTMIELIVAGILETMGRSDLVMGGLDVQISDYNS